MVVDLKNNSKHFSVSEWLQMSVFTPIIRPTGTQCDPAHSAFDLLTACNQVPVWYLLNSTNIQQEPKTCDDWAPWLVIAEAVSRSFGSETRLLAKAGSGLVNTSPDGREGSDGCLNTRITVIPLWHLLQHISATLHF